MHEVAIFKKPSGSGGKGLYELKPECYNEYNVYFYHYIRAEQSKVSWARFIPRFLSKEYDVSSVLNPYFGV